ncbi:hypothetical protein ACKGJO_06260 [Gracilimonas sp. Q87]|uniref:anti-sigma factor family protein n=1 Tax=Gracilimonas sp. Q87 TaxID=3384766 RepID=UPI00398423A3
MKFNKDVLKKLISKIPHTHEGEIGCDDCFEDLHTFAEMELEGKSPEKAMPLIREHLDNCGECRQEYQALLDAMKVLN